MSKLKLLTCITLLASFAWVENIYSYSVMSIEGNNRPLTSCQGKKILIITLPIQRNAAADSLLFSLDSLGRARASSLVIIGVPAIEDGYTNGKRNQLRLWYRNYLNTNIIITEGLRTQRNAAGHQHPLFKWLTDKNKNGHFDQDVTGPGQKFLVRSNGELFGVLGAQVRISSPTINRMLMTP